MNVRMMYFPAEMISLSSDPGTALLLIALNSIPTKASSTIVVTAGTVSVNMKPKPLAKAFPFVKGPKLLRHK